MVPSRPVDRPTRMAAAARAAVGERDGAEIARWIVHKWPRIKKEGREHTCLDFVFLEESGIWLLPQIRRTHAPGAAPLCCGTG